jgi:hypothetical protein
MRIGADGTKVPGQVQFEVDTGQAVIIFAVDLEDEEEIMSVIRGGFDEAREVTSAGGT